MAELENLTDLSTNLVGPKVEDHQGNARSILGLRTSSRTDINYCVEWRVSKADLSGWTKVCRDNKRRTCEERLVHQEVAVRSVGTAWLLFHSICTIECVIFNPDLLEIRRGPRRRSLRPAPASEYGP
jgi:hypothetical protein